MINWLSKLPSLKRNGNKDEFPSSELLKPFEDALGLPNVAFLVVYWICANYKKRSSTSLNVFFEKLSPLIGGYELKEAFSELIASGFIQVEQEDDDAYSITLTHNFEVALRSGEDLSQKTFISTNNSEDRMLLCIYAHAVLFKAKITALDSPVLKLWIHLRFDTQSGKNSPQSKTRQTNTERCLIHLSDACCRIKLYRMEAALLSVFNQSDPGP